MVPALALASLAGCGSQGSPADTGYLSVTPGQVEYITWKPTGTGHVSGSLTTESTSGSGSVLRLHYTVSGEVKGRVVNLMMRNASVTMPIHGILGNGTFTWQFNGPIGGPQSDVFKAASPADFASAVASLPSSQ